MQWNRQSGLLDDLEHAMDNTGSSLNRCCFSLLYHRSRGVCALTTTTCYAIQATVSSRRADGKCQKVWEHWDHLCSIDYTDHPHHACSWNHLKTIDSSIANLSLDIDPMSCKPIILLYNAY